MTLALDLSGLQWSPQQCAIFGEVSHGTGHVIVEALAGTGKSTVMVECLRRLPTGTRPLLCAFNKSIAEELQARAPKGVKVMTLHGLGYASLMSAWGRVVVDAKRGERHVSMAVSVWREERERAPRFTTQLEREVASVVSMCKARMVESIEQIEHEVRVAGLVLPSGLTDEDVCTIVATALDLAVEPDCTVSFDDMVYVPARLGITPRSQYDVVFVDETQDMSRAQLVLAQLALKPGGRLVLVGDRNQAIYGWRGADVGSMERMARELDATVLPLSITRRCPRSVVAIAQRFVPTFEAAPDAPTGTVRTISVQAADWTEGDLVVSRLNAPLTRCALAAIRAGKRARIQGRDFAQGFKLWAQSFGCKRASDLLQTARGWVQRELAKLGDGDQSAAEDLMDRVDTLDALSEGCATAEQVFARLDSLFSDEGPGLLFSSTHRAKGMERERAFVLAWTYRPETSDEETNLAYVAVTRAKRELVFVTHHDRSIKDETMAAIVEGASR